MRERLCIIGGVAAGMAAAAQARRNDPALEIIVFEKTEYISYSLCGMPFYIGNLIKTADELLVYPVSYFKTGRNIEVLVSHRVERIDPEKKELSVKGPGGEEKKFRYDKLLIATGARPVINREWPGLDLKNIFTFRHITSAMALKRTIEEEKPAQAVVIGSGLIGLSLAEALTRNQIRTVVIEKEERILGLFSEFITDRVREELEKNRVEVITGGVVEGFGGTGRVEKVFVKSRSLETGLVVLSIGVRPETELAAACGLSLEPVTGAVLVNNRMMTSSPHIYSAGDCTHTYSAITREKMYLPLATVTDKQAQIAADNMTGIPSAYEGSIGTVIEKVFSLQVARTGLTEVQMRKNNIPFVTAELSGKSRSGLFPQSSRIRLKVWSETGTGRLLGAEMCGEEGVEKRIDVLGLAIWNKMRLKDLYNIDFSYTPPFSPSRDILWQAGRIGRDFKG